jgi:hypothetical protein
MTRQTHSGQGLLRRPSRRQRLAQGHNQIGTAVGSLLENLPERLSESLGLILAEIPGWHNGFGEIPPGVRMPDRPRGFETVYAWYHRIDPAMP